MSAPVSELRPHLQHVVSSPSLAMEHAMSIPSRMNLRRSSSAGGGQLKLAEALLESLTERLNDKYRRIRFTPKSKAHDYEQRVSFDTINIEYNEDDTVYDFSDDELFPPDPSSRVRRLSLEETLRGRGRDRDFLGGRSPSTSPNRMLSPIRGMDLLLSINQIPYPTRPILTRKGCTFTRMHKDFENLYLGHLLKKGLCPVLPGRVILVYVSGRIHTWVSIDWILRSFIQNGDTIVFVSSLPHSMAPPSNKLSRYSSPTKYPPMTERMRIRQRNHPQYVKQVASNIMNYALSVINPNVIAKVIVEIAEGKTKDVLKDMYKLYEPNIVATGSKVNMKNSAPLKSWNSSRLSDRLVKNFPLPVIVVPALNMSFYEQWLAAQASGSNSPAEPGSPQLSQVSLTDKSTPGTPTKMPIAHSATDTLNDALYSSDSESLSDGSVTSDVSANSESSFESASSFHEIADLYDDYQRDVHRDLERLAAAPVDEHYFSNFMIAISDQSLRFCEDLRSVNPSLKGQGAKLARIITGSNSFGAAPYKTKSLLPPVEREKSEGASTGAISIADLKKSLKLNAERARQNQQHNSPQIVVTDESAAPQNRSLTFKEAERSSRRVNSRALMKYLSHEDTTDSRPKLEATKSHPDLRIMGDTEEKPKKKKKKKFWKLF